MKTIEKQIALRFHIHEFTAQNALGGVPSIDAELVSYVMSGKDCVAQVAGELRHLFVAAPELLNALRECLEVESRYSTREGTDEGRRHVHAKAWEVYAKATGGAR